MAKIKGAVVIDKERCKGCNLCVVACPVQVLALVGEVNGKGYNYSQMCHRMSRQLYRRVPPEIRGVAGPQWWPECLNESQYGRDKINEGK